MHNLKILAFLTFCLTFAFCKNQATDNEQSTNTTLNEPINEGHQLVKEMVEAVGGRAKFLSLKDVEYTYVYHNLGHNLKDISVERYRFDNEASWARFDLREKIMPHKKGLVVQGYDGKNTWVSIDGKKSEDSGDLSLASYMRKTNYYWFTMMYKLLDEGIIYEKLDDQIVDDQPYQRVKISHQENVGDFQNTYILYINPKTKLVDQFLFNSMDYNVTEPYLMTAKYEDIEGLKLMTHRKYRKSNWNGEAITDDWAGDSKSINIKFNNGFTPEDFNFSPLL